jgi:hypothetical protein
MLLFGNLPSDCLGEELMNETIKVDSYEDFVDKFINSEAVKYGYGVAESFINPIIVSIAYSSGDVLTEHQTESVDVVMGVIESFFTFIQEDLHFDAQVNSQNMKSDIRMVFYTELPSKVHSYLKGPLADEFGVEWRDVLDSAHKKYDGCFVFVYYIDTKNIGFTLMMDLNLPHVVIRKCMFRNFMKGMGAVPPKSTVLLQGAADSVFNETFEGEQIGEYDKMLLKNIGKGEK